MLDPAELARHYQRILDERMQDIAFLNPRLGVEAIGFRPHGEHSIGVLVTPWFMNLVVLPGNDEWDELPTGSLCRLVLPAGQMEFTVGGDETIGRLLTAVLFTTVADFPDPSTARDVGLEVLDQLFTDATIVAQRNAPRISRRALFTPTGSD